MDAMAEWDRVLEREQAAMNQEADVFEEMSKEQVWGDGPSPSMHRVVELREVTPLPPRTNPSPVMKSSEIRVTDPLTGGAKGSKLARFDMIPPDVLWELAEHMGKGEAKYPADETGLPNWQRGYDWRLSVAALHRHLNAFERGENLDIETGSSHLIAVIWHAMALRWFQLHGKGRDYRTQGA